MTGVWIVLAILFLAFRKPSAQPVSVPANQPASDHSELVGSFSAGTAPVSSPGLNPVVFVPPSVVPDGSSLPAIGQMVAVPSQWATPVFVGSGSGFGSEFRWSSLDGTVSFLADSSGRRIA